MTERIPKSRDGDESRTTERRRRIARWTPAGLLACAIVFASALLPRGGRDSEASKIIAVTSRDWTASIACETPEPACMLLVDAPNERVFVGTVGNGNIYSVSFNTPKPNVTQFAVGLGDVQQFGTTEVASMAFSDVNGDGDVDLVALTSQVFPRGTPSLFAWSLKPYPRLLATVRPQIESSWSHGLAPIHVGRGRLPCLLSTHCGYGELVEYRIDQIRVRGGRELSGFGWRKIATMPASGETIRAFDLGPEEQEICVAVGYSENNAQLRFYRQIDPSSPQNAEIAFRTRGLGWRLSRTIDEGKRFGNVRFAMGMLESPGVIDLVAFWTTEIAGGECEIIRYRTAADGQHSRTVLARGPAAELWPLENQIAIENARGGEAGRIYFASNSGTLWEHDGQRNAPPTALLRTEGGLGPIASPGPGRLLAASGRSIILLSRNGSGTARERQSIATWQGDSQLISR